MYGTRTGSFLSMVSPGLRLSTVIGQFMYKKILIPALLAVVVATSVPAFSQGRGHDDRGGPHGQDDRGPGRDNDRGRGGDKHGRGDGDRGDRGNNGNSRGNGKDYRGDRGAGPRHDMRRGGRLAPEYRYSRYVVNDWRGRRLNAPPRGYHWVQTGGDYVLVAIATGVILQILLNN